MSLQSPPLVSIQPPKDVSLSEIEAELGRIWQSREGDNGNKDIPSAMRATTFNFVVYEPSESQQILAALGFYRGPIDGIDGPQTKAAIKAAQKVYKLPVTGKGDRELLNQLRGSFENLKQGKEDVVGGANEIQYNPASEGNGIADAIAATNPCRIIALCPMLGEDEGVTAQVSAYCPVQKYNQNTLVCCEYITLRGTATALERIGGMISALMVSGLPNIVWWKATPDSEYGLFDRLAKISNNIVIDSSFFNDTETDLRKVAELVKQDTPIVDLNWRRLAPWQELTAAAFDPPDRRESLKAVDRVTIDYEKGNPAQALMFLGWLASRLQWRPASYNEEGGTYDLKRIKFTSTDQRTVEAELAAIPTADSGDIPGDLISLRLSSTDMEADCCTVLCSETTGCMRMEAGGGAQSCRIQQVTPLFDQKAEVLLSQQLRRVGREMLYTESLAEMAKILELK
jgi:glucose-6-phosphate dehydrogenase assembly protein OpcA